MAPKKKNISLALIAGSLASILVILTFTEKLNVFADSHIDRRIEVKTKEICAEQQKSVKELSQAVEDIKLVTVRLEAQIKYLERQRNLK